MYVMGLENVMDKNSRALRRFHRARMHARAIQMVQDWYWYSEKLDPKELSISASKHRDNMCICSCSGCGNQRRNKWNSRKYRLTVAERRNLAEFKEQLKEVDLLFGVV
jgi:hypothetical protein